MAIGGEQRPDNEGFRNKYVGLFEGKVLCVNPDEEDFKEILGIELTEDSKATEYLGETDDGTQKVRISVWVEDVKSGEKFPVQFFLQNKERENKDMTKKQYINSLGSCTWADDPNNLPDWFKKRDYRVANVGEEELYNFLRFWLAGIDYTNDKAELQLDWKRLMKGNVKEIREQIDGEFSKNVGFMAEVVTREKDGETKEFQSVYNKAFVPQYALKQFRLVDYSNPDVQERLKAKEQEARVNKKIKLLPHERFVLTITGEYGSKNYFILKDMVEYSSDMNFAASDKVINPEDSSY